MEKDIILEKILNQSQLTGIIAWLQMQEFPGKDSVIQKLEIHYAFTEIIWERYFQGEKLIIAKNIQGMIQDKELSELRAEVSKLTKTLSNDL